MVVKWLDRALGNLATISAYIERDNPESAKALVQMIREKTNRLQTFPLMGRESEKAGIRELIVHDHYLISYRIRRDTIEVLQVWHSAEDREHKT